MKLGLFGFGKAGRSVASVLMETQAVDLSWIARKSHRLENRPAGDVLGSIGAPEGGLILSTDTMSADALFDAHPVDAVVDFAAAETIHYYGDAAARRGIAIVSAVSHYPAETSAYLRRLAETTRVLHSPNITLGINFLMLSSKILQNIAPDTDIEIVEEHFKTKPEISGTARIIADELGLPHDAIKSVRAGGIIGVHEVLFGFPFQTVRLKHESISREAFGSGILFALENLPPARAGFFTMEDLLLPKFNLNKSEADFLSQGRKPWWKVW